MANSEDKKLAIDVIARVDKLEKAMAKASATTKTQTGRMEKSVASMRTRMDKDFTAIGSAIASRVAAPLLALGAAGIIRAVGDVARGMAEIGDEAKRAGVGVEAFQELKYVAEQSRVGIDALTDGLKEMNLRADEFIVSGKGSSAEAFQRLGYDAETLAEKLHDPSALFTEIIGKLGQLDQAAQIRVADEVFGGTGGEQFVQLIAQGEQGIRDTIDRAHELGQVLSADTVSKAQELNQAFSDVANTVATELQQNIVNATWALFDFLQQFSSVEDRTTASLENKLRELGRRRVEVEAQILQTQAAVRDWTGADQPLAAMKTQLALLKQEMADIAEQEAPIVMALDARTPITPPGTSKVPTVPGSGAGAGRDDAERKALAEAAAVLKLIDALEFEQSTIGMTARDLAIANALRDAGSAATAEQRAQIESLVGANFDLRDSIEDNAEAMRMFEDTASGALRSFIDDLLAGKDAGEALRNVLSSLGSQLINAGISSLTSGLSTLIFPHANGGIAAHGRPKQFASGGVSDTAAIFGEAGPEAAVPLPDGRRIPVDLRIPTRPANDNGAMSVSVPISIDATGADAAGLARLEQSLVQLKSELPIRIRAEVKGRGKRW